MGVSLGVRVPLEPLLEGIDRLLEASGVADGGSAVDEEAGEVLRLPGPIW
jgi:hypothetical protein